PPSATGSELSTTFIGIPYTTRGFNGNYMHVYRNFWGNRGVPTTPDNKAHAVAHELGRYFAKLPDQGPKRLGFTLADSPIVQLDEILDYINDTISNRYRDIINYRIKIP